MHAASGSPDDRGKKRWVRGHAVWVSDVLAFRGSPAAWAEELVQVVGVTIRSAEPGEPQVTQPARRRPGGRRRDDREDSALLVGSAVEHSSRLPGPFGAPPSAVRALPVPDQVRGRGHEALPLDGA